MTAAPAPVAGRQPTIGDVARCYRLFLGRDIESVAVAGTQIAGSATVLDLVDRIWRSPEALRGRIAEAFSCAYRDHVRGQTPAMTAPSGAAGTRLNGAMIEDLWRIVETAWARRGLGSYHAWLTRDTPRYADRSVQWNVERMFDAGQDEARDLRLICARHGRDLREDDTIMVLGADALRLAAAIAPAVARYLGVDPVSDGLVRAGAALQARGIDAAEGMTIAEFRCDDRGYDVAYCVSALQYVPPPLIVDLLKTISARLNPGGLLLFQVACQLYDYRFEIGAYLAGDDRDPMGEIHAIAQTDILGLMRRNAMTLLEVMPDGRVGPLGTSFLFVAQKGMQA